MSNIISIGIESLFGRNTKLKRYRSHKEVWAAKITDIAVTETCITLSFENDKVSIGYDLLHQKPSPKIGMYLIIYNDGYFSFSPADAFESGYSEVPFADGVLPGLVG